MITVLLIRGDLKPNNLYLNQLWLGNFRGAQKKILKQYGYSDDEFDFNENGKILKPFGHNLVDDDEEK